MSIEQIPVRQVRAVYDDTTIRVYQAYNNAIADSALATGTFVAPPFKMSRMTWIKPSFLWMMYRCGWARKDEGQVRVLAIDITREGFAWALANSCSSHPKGLSRSEARELMDAKPVRVQWDPERDLHHRPLPHRSIQIGLRGEAVERYVGEWVTGIEDVTELAIELGDLVARGNEQAALAKLPPKQPYTLSPEIASIVGVESGG